MDTKKLQLLLETIQSGSMKSAAKNLNYTQSGLVYMLNSLEEELGIPLLNRNFRGVSLTAEGKILEPYIRQIVENTHALEEQIERLSASKQTELYIGSYPAIARHVLPYVSDRFMQSHPNVSIHIYSGTEEILVWLENGDVDFGICERRISKNYHWIPLFRDEVYAAVPANKEFAENESLSLSELEEFAVYMPSYNTKSAGNKELLEWASSRGKLRNFEIKAPDGTAQLSLVSYGLGITFLSSLYRFECPASVQMLPLDPPMYREAGCIIRDVNMLTPLVKEYISSLKEHIKLEVS